MILIFSDLLPYSRLSKQSRYGEMSQCNKNN